MSMLSAQCDELRAMAESVGLSMPQAATLMMEAADTIWELRCKCAGMVDMRERARLAEVENAKLRELCKELLDLCYDAYEQEWGWDDDWALAYEQAKKLGVTE